MINKVIEQKLSDFPNRTEHYDMMICCSSFEQRCLALTSNIRQDNVDEVLVCQYNNPAELSQDNCDKLCALWGSKCEVLSLDKDAPLSIYDAIYEKIKENNPGTILFDISTFTRETILIILMIFKQDRFKDIETTLCYVPADRYSMKSLKDHEIWLSKGVNDVRSVLGYSGSFSSLKKTLLIVLVGFETDRADILISTFEADKIYLGYVPSEESFSSDLSRINQSNFDRLVKLIGDCETFSFSCRDINKTIREIEKIIIENKDDYNIIISPMNNKLSTLAVASVAYAYPDVQVCYASTNQYNTEAYSSPDNRVLLFKYE
ncbi:MAG: hypothetical protein MJY68_04635 [Bacteroidaceae bacterium]|nr:hypothetical protein [Bacteroidaceae bacterium]